MYSLASYLMKHFIDTEYAQFFFNYLRAMNEHVGAHVFVGEISNVRVISRLTEHN